MTRIIYIIVIVVALFLLYLFFYSSIFSKNNDAIYAKNNFVKGGNELKEDLNSDIFVFKGADNKEMKKVLIDFFAKISSDFSLDFDGQIEVTIYNDQNEFWQSVFPNNENNGKTTGFADHVNNKIYLTSIDDTSIKSKQEMLKVPVHELTHVLFPHPWIDVREGMAVYLAGQLKNYHQSKIPDNLYSIINYQGDIEEISSSYSFAGWKIKYILEEGFDNDYKHFLEFIDSPGEELDYKKIGFSSQGEFIDSFKNYLIENAK